MSDKMIRIAVDAMGGDNFPQVQIEGSLEALISCDDVEITLVGDKDVVEKSLKKIVSSENKSGLKPGSLELNRIKIVHADDVIGMSESPARAIRSKKNSSLVIANKLCRSKEIEAVISAGNTGAAMASSLLYMGRLTGVSRPAIMALFPSKNKYVAILDIGANSDCKPEQLYQFGVMASIYTSHVLGYEKPRVGLLSIGEERSKGNELTEATYSLFEDSNLNFIGNIEGRDIFEGTADVVVCDGFVGNVLLKFGESAFGFIEHSLKKQISKSFLRKIGALLLKTAFYNVKEEMNVEEYGGAPLLGVNGVSIICHGNSSPTAIKNAIKVARRLVLEEVNSEIENEFSNKTE
ncbi:phosphate acyltransferase PlsX [Candidatus Latescibacterota bacterium]